MSNRSSRMLFAVAVVLVVVSVPGLLFASHAAAKVVYSVLLLIAAGLAARGLQNRKRVQDPPGLQ